MENYGYYFTPYEMIVNEEYDEANTQKGMSRQTASERFGQMQMAEFFIISW